MVKIPKKNINHDCGKIFITNNTKKDTGISDKQNKILQEIFFQEHITIALADILVYAN